MILKDARLLRQSVIITTIKRILGSAKHNCCFNKRLPFITSNVGNKIAVIDVQEKYSYHDLLQLSCGLKETLKRSNPDIRAGDRIAFLTPHNASYVVCQWAVWLLGAINVPLCSQHPPSEIEYVLQNSQSSMVLSTPDYSEMIEVLAEKVKIQHITFTTTNLPKINVNFEEHDLVEQSGLMMYTSGTTGRPKGVVHTHESINAQVQSLTDAWEMSDSDVVLHVLPLHHTHGVVNLLVNPLSVGATVVMDEKFNPEKVWKHLLQQTTPAINVYMAVPTIYMKLIEYFDKNNMCPIETRKQCENIRLMVSGSSALPKIVLEKWQDITGHVLLERYGMTETGMILTNPYRGKRKLGSVGLPFPRVSVHIVPPNEDGTIDLKKSVVHADDSNVVETAGCEGVQGELLIKSPLLFKCYYNNPSATTDSFVEGWFRTGDTVLYEKGAFRIVGRTSVDIIKSGGYKISALDIEQHLLDHPRIREVSVVGVPDPVWGQRVAALVSTEDGNDLTMESLKEWCRDRMPTYHVPTMLKIVDELPRNVMGKINKKELVEIYFSDESVGCD